MDNRNSIGMTLINGIGSLLGSFKYIGELFFSKVGTNCVASKTSGLLIQTNVPVMDLSKQLFKEMLGSYLQTTFSQVLPEILKESLQKSDLWIGQDFVSLDEAGRRYNLCRKTLYNYHNKKYITLYSSEGKTFVSVRELEAHIKKNPLPRTIGMKAAA
jgi:hypothetical protein